MWPGSRIGQRPPGSCSRRLAMQPGFASRNFGFGRSKPSTKARAMDGYAPVRTRIVTLSEVGESSGIVPSGRI